MTCVGVTCRCYWRWTNKLWSHHHVHLSIVLSIWISIEIKARDGNNNTEDNEYLQCPQQSRQCNTHLLYPLFVVNYICPCSIAIYPATTHEMGRMCQLFILIWSRCSFLNVNLYVFGLHHHRQLVQRKAAVNSHKITFIMHNYWYLRIVGEGVIAEWQYLGN